MDSSPRCFADLPIEFADVERKDGWERRITRHGTVADLLGTWDISDETERSEMAQVLRHLKGAMEKLDRINHHWQMGVSEETENEKPFHGKMRDLLSEIKDG